MGKARAFYTVPTRAMRDERLSAVDHRTLGCVSIHDGMSQVKGKGAGCYASNQTLAAKVGCDYTTLSKSLSRLQEWGYIIKERQVDDRRMTTYRVNFAGDDSWQDGQSIVGKTANRSEEVVGLDASDRPEVVGEQFSETRRNQPETGEHYIPLKGELDSVETGELNSLEKARLTSRFARRKDDGPKVGAELARLERALKSDPLSVDLVAWIGWIESLIEVEEDDSLRAWATRLADAVLEAMPKPMFQQWQAKHGWEPEWARAEP
jgi:DNA-binding MarR family transcriptional regulator